MRKETVKNYRNNDPELLAGCIAAGSIIKYGDDWDKAQEAAVTIGIGCFLACNKLKNMTTSQVVSFAAGRKAEVVESDGPSDEGIELRTDGKHWELFVDGECFHQKNFLTGKCLDVLRILPA